MPSRPHGVTLDGLERKVKGPRPRMGVLSAEDVRRWSRPEKVPRIGRVPDRKTPSLAIGGSAHSRPTTSRTGNTSYIRFWSRRTLPGAELIPTQPRCRAEEGRAPPPTGAAIDDCKMGYGDASFPEGAGEGMGSGDLVGTLAPGNPAVGGKTPPPGRGRGRHARAVRRDPRPTRSGRPTSDRVGLRAAAAPRARRSPAPCSSADGTGIRSAASPGSARRP